MGNNKSENISFLMGYLDSNDDFRYLRDYDFDNIKIAVARERTYYGPISWYPAKGEDLGRRDEAFASDLIDALFLAPTPIEQKLGSDKLMKIGDLLTMTLFMAACADKLYGVCEKPGNDIAGYKPSGGRFSSNVTIDFMKTDGSQLLRALLYIPVNNFLGSGSPSPRPGGLKIDISVYSLITKAKPHMAQGVEIGDIGKTLRRLIAEIDKELA